MNAPITWPHGKRIAVAVSCMVETWSPGHWPTYFTRTTPLRSGTLDFAGINWSQYGAREGIWRLLYILNNHGIKGTVQLNGKSAELYPDVVQAAVSAGHAIVAHGYYQNELLLYMTPEDEKAAIRKTMEAIEKAAGRRPRGWATPIYGFSERTIDYLIDEKIVWTHDTLDTSLPYRSSTERGSIVLFPWTDFVDNRVLRADPSGLFNAQKDAFDYLRAKEALGIVHIGLHAHVGGRPTMAAQVDRLLAYFKTFDDVWFTCPDDIVQWMETAKIDDLAGAAKQTFVKAINMKPRGNAAAE